MAAESLCSSGTGGLSDLVNTKCEVELIQKNCHDFGKSDPEVASLIKACPEKESSLLRDLAYGCKDGFGDAWADTYKHLIRDPFVFMTQKSVEATKRYLEKCGQSLSCKEALFYETHLRRPSEKEYLKLEKMKSFAEMDVFYRNAMQVRNSSGQQNLRFQQQGKNIEAIKTAPNSSFWQTVQKVIDDKTDKFQCLNREGKTLLVCYAIFSVVDPAVGVAAAAKLPKLKALLKTSNVKYNDYDSAIKATSEAQHSAKGLSLDGKRLIGSLDGDKVAQVVHQAYEKHGIKIIVDDSKFKNKTALATAGQYTDTIYVRSSFLDQPNLGLLLHEIKHVISEHKNNPTRLMRITVTDPQQMNTKIGSYGYSMRFDEVEARFGQAAANGASHDLTAARVLAREQKKSVTEALEAIAKDDMAIQVINDPWGNSVMQVYYHIDAKSTSTAFKGKVLEIPYPNSFATEAEYKAFAKEILNQRVKEIEVLEAGRLKTPATIEKASTSTAEQLTKELTENSGPLLFKPVVSEDKLLARIEKANAEKYRSLMGVGDEAKVYAVAEKTFDGVKLYADKIYYKDIKTAKSDYDQLHKLNSLSQQGHLGQFSVIKPLEFDAKRNAMKLEFLEGQSVLNLIEKAKTKKGTKLEPLIKKYWDEVSVVADKLRQQGFNVEVSDLYVERFNTVYVRSGNKLQFTITPKNVLVDPKTGKMTIIDPL